MKIILYARTILFMALLGMSLSCSGNTAVKASDYDKLCEIYKEIVPLKTNLVIKIAKITEKVKKE